MTQAETRRLAAIMFTDIVGFSRQMSADEARMLRLLVTHNQIIQHAVSEHHGTVIKTIGDAFLVDFPSVVHAVQCAQRIQAHFHTHNVEKDTAEQIHVRIGIHLGDIVQRDGDVFGEGVNIASRLQGLAEPDTLCISDVVYRDVAKKLDLGTVVSLGRPHLKNIAERFPVYALLPEQPKGFRQALHVQRWKLKHQKRVWQMAAVAAVAMGVMGVGTLVLKTRYIPFAPQSLPPERAAMSTPSLPLPDKPSIVVLPFVNMSDDPGQEYFSDGITEDLTSAFSRLSGLFVISRNTAFFYKGKTIKIPELSKELGVQYVLEGSVRKADKQVRITIQLIDAPQDHHLWSERYDRDLQNVFALQDEIVQQIVTTLKLQLALWEQGRLVRKTTENLEAYDSYLRGVEASWRALNETNKEANAQARQLFEHATALDPTYAEAYAWLGWTSFIDWFSQWNPTPQTLAQAGELAQQALTLDESLPVPHLVLGMVSLWKKQHDQAITEAERALALDPNHADSYVNLGGILTFAGRPGEAIGLIEKAMRLNPRYPPNYLFQLSVAYRVAGRYEEALAPGKKVVTLTPHSGPALFNLAVIYSELGREEEARDVMAENLRLVPTLSVEMFRQFLPFKDPAVLERHLAALRRAGLK